MTASSATPGLAVRLPCGAGSTLSTSPTSISCLAFRSADRRSPCGSLPVNRAGAEPFPEERWVSRTASSVPLPPAAGRIRVSMRSPYSASGAGSAVASISVGSR